MREAYQKYWDLTAVLHLFGCANTIAPIDGNFKIQKLGFISELRGQEENLRAAHYKFFRYNFGPYSKDLANDVGFLKQRRFLDPFNRLTERGKYLMRYLWPEIQANDNSKTSLTIIDNVCHEFGKFTGLQLRRKVYDMTVPVIDYSNCPLRVQDIGLFTDILDPIRMDLRESANFPADTIEDLKEEFCLPIETLDPENPTVRAEVDAILQKIA